MTHDSPAARAAMSNGAGSIGAQGSPLIVLIDPRALFGECVVVGLQSVDKVTQFRRYPNLADWRAGDWQATSLVVLCLQSRIGGAARTELDESIAVLKGCEPPPAFAVISNNNETGHILECLERGARGYIPTSLSLQVVTQALHLINAGGVFVPATSLAELAAQQARPAAPPNKNALSPKEISVAEALRKGTPNKIIAYNLGMCESTVKVHVRNIMKKLKAKNRTEVAYLSNEIFVEAEKLNRAPGRETSNMSAIM